jgi:hypothetical protein
MAKPNAGRIGTRATAGKTTGKAQQSRRRRPPWGNILDSKPIERHAYVLGAKIEVGDTARRIQHARMVRLMRHYGIAGRVPTYPIAGVGDVGWLPWYQLALAIASDLDESLEIIDAKPRGKTAPRWRTEGRVLLRMVDRWRERRPTRSIRWCLIQMQKEDPEYYGQIPFPTLKARYHEAKRRNVRGAK